MIRHQFARAACSSCAQALHEAQLLPRIISGSSAGSLVAALVRAPHVVLRLGGLVMAVWLGLSDAGLVRSWISQTLD